MAIAFWFFSIVAHAQNPVDWQPWSTKVFSQAKASHKFVLLDLESVWCHWCHVMDEQTYRDENVRKILSEHYIAVKVDQDARPDLANRYRDYGWPATIIFDGDGRELAKVAGYVNPAAMQSLLQKIVTHPEPIPETTAADEKPTQIAGDLVSADILNQLRARQYKAYDDSLGGLKTAHKYLEADFVEYALAHGAGGEKRDADMARKTLTANKQLIDPIWGGVYQYSTNGDWKHPHFEKIVPTQSVNMRLYSLASSAFGGEYRQAVKDIDRYIDGFLTSADGSFYTSQDADVVQGEHSAEYFAQNDIERRAKGIPRVDTNRYGRENGMLIAALATAYAAFGDEKMLDKAVRSATWVLANRAIVGGGFRHGNKTEDIYYLGDSLYMGNGLLALYAATGDSKWLSASCNAADFIIKNFSASNQQGFLTAADPTAFLKPLPTTPENIVAARYLNLLYQYTGEEKYREAAKGSVRYLGRPAVALDSIVESGILLAYDEVTSEPLHLTIVGKKDDPSARALYREVLRYYSSYKRTEWWDKSDGPLPRNDLQYPEFPRAAAYICTTKRCSAPIFDSNQVSVTLNRLLRRVA